MTIRREVRALFGGVVVVVVVVFVVAVVVVIVVCVVVVAHAASAVTFCVRSRCGIVQHVSVTLPRRNSSRDSTASLITLQKSGHEAPVVCGCGSAG